MDDIKDNLSAIASFLESAKQLLSHGKYDFVPRQKNLQSLANHGLSIENVKSEITSLTVKDYYSGPKKDYDQNKPGDVWEFKKSVDGEIFYVKLKIVNDELKCLSFHEDEEN